MAVRRRLWVRRAAGTVLAASVALSPVLGAAPVVAAASLCGPPADTVPPHVVSVSLSRQHVSLSRGSRSVDLRLHIDDTSGSGALSGVAAVQVIVLGPVHKQYPSGVSGGLVGTMHLTSGTASNGIWTWKLSIPTNAMPGNWTVHFIRLRDKAGNALQYDVDYPTAPMYDILRQGWHLRVAVTGVPTRASRLTGFRMTPTTVSTRAHAKVVHISTTFARPWPTHASAILAGGPRFYSVPLKRGKLGTWTGRLVVPRWIGNQTLAPAVTAVAAGGDSTAARYWSGAALDKPHFSRALHVTSRTDSTAPTVTTLSVTPASVDTTSGPVKVAVSATLADAQSGVARAVIDATIVNSSAPGPAQGLYPIPYDGFSMFGEAAAVLHRSGSKWVGTMTIARCVPAGTWTMSADLTDKAGNEATNAAATGSVNVTSSTGDTAPPTVLPSPSASAQDHTISIQFDEGVKNVSPSTLSVYTVPAGSSYAESAVPVTGISCMSGNASADCDGSSGLVTAAVLTVPSLVSGSRYALFANQDDVRTQLTDGLGNPMDWGEEIWSNVTAS